MDAKMQEQLVLAAVGALTKADVKFKVIAGDKEYGELVVEKERTGIKRTHRYPRGQLRSYLMQFDIASMKPGDVRIVPLGDYPVQHLASNITAYMHSMWGSGAYKTTSDDVCILACRLESPLRARDLFAEATQ